MFVYRITLEKYSSSLLASGNGARWNSKGVEMIYTASNRALACLENVVHRTALGLNDNFRTMVIDLPETLSIQRINKTDLMADWHLFQNYHYTRAMGDKWVSNNESAVLVVPSAIIAEEVNYLINPAHEEFNQIKLLRVEPFQFDPRIKNDSFPVK